VTVFPRILVLEHEQDTDVGLIGAAAEASGGELTVINPRSMALPAPDAFDAIIVLGSVESTYDPTIDSWFRNEVELIRNADARGTPILGICFGAQALATALGGKVHRAPYGEFGWKVVETTAPDVVPEGPWFQWHTDTIEPPPQASIIATSDCCVQAFLLGPHLAVQFHPEVGLAQATEWPESDPKGLAESGLSARDMIEITAALIPDAQRRANELWHQFEMHAMRTRSSRSTR
jgi:GMP synthase-like glutamine amidotransferase